MNGGAAWPRNLENIVPTHWSVYFPRFSYMSTGQKLLTSSSSFILQCLHTLQPHHRNHQCTHLRSTLHTSARNFGAHERFFSSSFFPNAKCLTFRLLLSYYYTHALLKSSPNSHTLVVWINHIAISCATACPFMKWIVLFMRRDNKKTSWMSG